MSCCGKTIKNIIQGKVNNFIGKDFEFTRARIAKCRRCDDKTFMTKKKYTKWLLKNGIIVLKNIDDLSVLPILGKKEYEKGDRLYCSVCKCFIPEKARVKENTCPMNKWEK